MRQQHEWVRDRLDNWADWLGRSERGALGYPRQSTIARYMPAGGSDGAHVPVDEVMARATHDAVEGLRFRAPRLYLVVHLRWVGDPRVPPDKRGGPLGVEATGLALCVAVSTVYALQARALDELALVLKRG
jgi:hypothetical protein